MIAQDPFRAGPDYFVAWCGTKKQSPPFYIKIQDNIKKFIIITNLTLTNLKYKRKMSLDHLKQFLLTVLDVKSVMIVSISILSSSPFSMHKVAKLFNLS